MVAQDHIHCKGVDHLLKSQLQHQEEFFFFSTYRPVKFWIYFFRSTNRPYKKHLEKIREARNQLCVALMQGSHGIEKPGKSREFVLVFFPGLEVWNFKGFRNHFCTLRPDIIDF